MLAAIQEPGSMPVPTDPVLPPEVPRNPSENGPPDPINVPSPQPDTIDDPMDPGPVGIPIDVPDTGPSTIPSDQPGTMMT